MLTPSFELSQNADFVLVRIRLPHLKADEGEFYVLDREFKFHLRPYFLRLTFRHCLVEDGRERAEHDLDSGVLTVWLPKATPGEHFEGLHLLTELLRKPSAAPARPLIEVVSSSDHADATTDGMERMCVEDKGSADEEDGDDLEDDLGHLAEAEQQLPPLVSDSTGAAYGFNGAYSRIFVGLEEDEIVQVPNPETSSAQTRRAGRRAAEEACFDADHYIADFMEADRATAALEFVPWWHKLEAVAWSDEAHGAAPAAARREAVPVAGTASTSTSASAPAGTASEGGGGCEGEGEGDAYRLFGLGTEYNAQLLQLPRKEFLLDSAERRRALCGLIDLLFAYAYDIRTTEGEPTVESGWTVRRVSATLGWLDSFDSVAEAAVASVERSLCYPLVRHFEVARTTLADVGVLLRLGRLAVLRALLDLRTLVQRGVEHGYLLNRIWLDDYCVWLQQLPACWLAKLADKLESVGMRRELVRWPLQAYEELAAEEDDGETDGEDEDEGGRAGLHAEEDVSMGDGVLV